MQPVLYEPGQLLAGTVYRVIRHLATGGMGSVYDVEDTSVEKRYVLKTLHPQLIARDDLARRMRDEAKSLARLQHPNIVDVITAGVTKDELKLPFYIMERLVGQNLRMVLRKQGAIDASSALRIAIDVADALEHAHENNIVHRDVKPDNIFLHRTPNGATTTKLLDFGIVRLLDRKASHTHGKFIGTLRYASPEQVGGGEIGPASDIYSLGLVLFEMLAGRGPFDDVGDALAIGAAQAEQSAPLLSRYARVAPGIERIVASALAKDPRARPRSAFAFGSELRRMLDEEERTPRSATEVDVISAVVATADLATETGGITVHGMIPPSSIAPSAATAVAPTLLAGRSPDGEDGAIDRGAPTRTCTRSGGTQRLATHDTKMAGMPEPARYPAATTPLPALARPLGGPPEGGDHSLFRQSNATGPIAGEASTRPSERGPLVLVGVAVAVAIALVGGTSLVVHRSRGSTDAAASGAAQTRGLSPTAETMVAASSAISPVAVATASDLTLSAPAVPSALPSSVVRARAAPKSSPPAASPVVAPAAPRVPAVTFDP